MPHHTTKHRWDNRDSEDLFRVILLLSDLDEAKKFFRDLLTETEVKEFAHRWKVVKMLKQGIPYTRIEKETGMSSTTIARIQWWLQKGMGGYRGMLQKIRKGLK